MQKQQQILQTGSDHVGLAAPYTIYRTDLQKWHKALQSNVLWSTELHVAIVKRTAGNCNCYA